MEYPKRIPKIREILSFKLYAIGAQTLKQSIQVTYII